MINIQLKKVITEPSKLYGRNISHGLIEKLTNHLERANNVQVVGERRFGKTSLLKCMETTLKNSPKFIPIYIDLKEYSFIKGNSNVYRFIISKSLFELSNQTSYNENVNLRGVTFKPIKNWEDFYEELIKVQDYRINDLLREFYNFFSELYSLTFVLLIDEYEHLFLYSFEDPKGFFLFRNISQYQIDNINSPLCFIIAGTMTWDKICTITGSAELNTLSTEIMYVNPLEKEYYKKWWEDNIAPLNCEKINLDEIYHLSGGVPFYSLIIIETIILSGKIVLNTLYPHFEEVYKNFDADDNFMLHSIVKKQPIQKNNYVIQSLISRGIIISEGKKYTFRSSLFSDYYSSKINSTIKIVDEEQVEFNCIVLEIFSRIASINETRENKLRPICFSPVNQDVFLQKDMQLKCIDLEGIKRFSGAVYHVLFEKTKGKKTLDLLPNQFGISNDFVKTVDSLRHFFGGHLKDKFILKPGQLSKGDLLNKILGTANNPTDSDYVKMQKYVLVEFDKYLKQIEIYVKK